MRRLALAAGGALVALALSASAPAASPAGDPCKGIPRCISVPGPWVAVPATGEVDYLMECPGGNGIIGGTDALVTSQQIFVSFDGIPGSPVKYGRTTNYEAFFRAVAGDHRAGEFEPFIGCIPTRSASRITTGVPVAPLGAPLDLRARSVTIVPGGVSTATMSCRGGERLVDSWSAIAFETATPTPVSFAAAIRVVGAVHGGVAGATVVAGKTLPLSAPAFVQLGVRCTPA